MSAITISAKAEAGGGKRRPASSYWRALRPLVIVATATLGIWVSQGIWPDEKAVLAVIGKWTPLLLQGFAVDLAILIGSMVCGTVLGLAIGLALLSPNRMVRWPVMPLVQLLRNSPGLVFLFFVAFALPFKFTIFGMVIPFPGWVKVVFSFSLKISASVAEILRGAVQSIGKGQSEAASALGMSRRQAFWLVILPQCLPRMVPPWMNVVAIFLAAVPMASLVGIYDAVSYASLAIKAEQRPELIIPFYGYITAWFFATGYALHEASVLSEHRSR